SQRSLGNRPAVSNAGGVEQLGAKGMGKCQSSILTAERVIGVERFKGTIASRAHREQPAVPGPTAHESGAVADLVIDTAGNRPGVLGGATAGVNRNAGEGPLEKRRVAGD